MRFDLLWARSAGVRRVIRTPFRKKDLTGISDTVYIKGEVKSMKVPLIIDYCTLNVPENSFTVKSLSEYLIDEDMKFKPVGKSKEPNMYTSPFGVTFQVNGGYNKEQVIRFSGTGCENFPYSIGKLHREYNARVSRIDLTFDSDITVDDWRNYLSEVFQQYMNSDRKAKVYTLITGNKKDAATINIGSRRSPFFFRIYNKTLEEGKEAENDKYKIRFECELKRFTRTRNGEKEIYDPTHQYELYWKDIKALSTKVKSYWESYAPDFILPYCWEEIEFDYPEQIKNFVDMKVTVKEHIQRETVLRNIRDFDRVLRYIVKNYGQYLPFIIDDNLLLRKCIEACKEKRGISFDIDVTCFVDLIDIEEWQEVVDEYDYSNEQLSI